MTEKEEPRRVGRLAAERIARRKRAAARHAAEAARAAVDEMRPAPAEGDAGPAGPPVLRGKQKRHLRGLAHHLEPVVVVGKEGLSDSILKATDRALADHELVKVRVLESSPIERRECAAQLAVALAAAQVGEIGRIVMLYRPHPKKPRIVLPRS